MNITLTVDRFEGDQAILVTDERESILWPKNKLPPEIKEGAVINFIIGGNEQTEESRRQAAKDILNEILEVKP